MCDVQWARVATACDDKDDGLELEACLIPGTLTPIFTARLQALIRYSDIRRETIFNTGYRGHTLLGDGVYRIKLQRENAKRIQLRKNYERHLSNRQYHVDELLSAITLPCFFKIHQFECISFLVLSAKFATSLCPT
jgi:hypothetical protein